MKKIKWIILLAAPLFLLSCTQKAFVQKDNSINISQFKTYAWAEAYNNKDLTTKRPSKNSLRDQKIHEAVVHYLQEAGWKESQLNPDVYLVFDVVIEKENKDVKTPVYSQPTTRWYYQPTTKRWVPVYYPANFLGYNTNTKTVREGTLTLTLMNPSTDKEIWQGWSSTEIYGKRITDKQIDATVKAIINKIK